MKTKKILKIIILILIMLILSLWMYKLSLYIKLVNIDKKMIANFENDYYMKVQEENYTIEVWKNDKYTKKETKFIERDSIWTDWLDNENEIFIINDTPLEEAYKIYSLENKNDILKTSILGAIFVDQGISSYNVFRDIWSNIIKDYRSAIFLLDPFIYVNSITTETLNGKECYKVSIFNYMVYYIEKDTNLIVKEIDVLNDRIVNYEYSFEKIKDEEIGIPDLENAYIQVY